MTAKIIQLRDYRRKEEKLKEQAAEILSQIDTGSGIDGLVYESSIGFVAPPEDCA